MLPRNHPDHIQIAFDDHRLVANAGLLLPATLAHHLGLSRAPLSDARRSASPCAAASSEDCGHPPYTEGQGSPHMADAARPIRGGMV